MSTGSSAEPTAPSADLVEIEVGQFRVTPEVAAWIVTQVGRYEPQGLSRGDVIGDLLSAAYRQEVARRETKEDRRAKDASGGRRDGCAHRRAATHPRP